MVVLATGMRGPCCSLQDMVLCIPLATLTGSSLALGEDCLKHKMAS